MESVEPALKGAGVVAGNTLRLRGVMAATTAGARTWRVAGGRLRWYACYTRGRHEKRVEERLAASGFDSYLPVLIEERSWSDRRKRIAVPLFPSYVFGRFRNVDLVRILRVPGVVTVVGNERGPTPIADADIEQVRMVLERASEHGVAAETDCWVTKGAEVLVTRGPFQGICGVVIQRRGRTHVLVRISTIRRGVAIAVPMCNLKLQNEQATRR